MKVDFVKFSKDRKHEYEISTLIYTLDKKRKVRKTALNTKSRRHIDCIAENEKILKRRYGEQHINKCYRINNAMLDFDYIQGETLSERLIKAFERGDQDKFNELIDIYIENIVDGSDEDIECEIDDPHSEKRKYNIDINFDNVIFDNKNEWHIVDYEWLFTNVSKKFVLYRALSLFASTQTNNSLLIDSINNIIHHKFSCEEQKYYIALERDFQNLVSKEYKKQYKRLIITSYAIYKAIIYPFIDERYSKENAIFPQTTCKKGVYTSYFPLNGEAVKKLRFDPLEGAAAEVEIIGIKTDAKDYTIAAVNAIKHEGDIYTFITFDPIFEITGDFTNASYIAFEYTLRILPTEEIARLGQEQKILLEQAKGEIAARDREITAIKCTRGYRVLEKIRDIKDKF